MWQRSQLCRLFTIRLKLMLLSGIVMVALFGGASVFLAAGGILNVPFSA